MQRDTVLTVAIGRNGSDGKPMLIYQWSVFKLKVKSLIKNRGTIVFCGESVEAIGSDGVNDGIKEDSYAIIAINVSGLDMLRAEIAEVLDKYRQSSACFAIDAVHEPVFATYDGYRPQE